MGKRNRKTLQFFLWTAAFLLVIVIGAVYIPMEYPDMGVWQTLYYTLRLFVFEHDFPEFPTHWPLIFIHFWAPLLTVSAVGTAVSYVLSLSPGLAGFTAKDHVVVCGVGRTGTLFCETLKKEGLKVIGIDKGPADDYADWMDETGVKVLFGDFHQKSMLEKAGVQNARSVLFASGNDLANLEGALAAYEWLQNIDCEGVRLIWTQLTNEKLTETARFFIRTQKNTSIRFFDTYRMAAVKMIQAHFDENQRKGVKEIFILGFGKFGHDLMDVLLNELGSSDTIKFHVVDIRNREKAVLRLAKSHHCENRIFFTKAALGELSFSPDPSFAYFICTDDDLGNLTATMSLAGNKKLEKVFVRMTHWPLLAVSQDLAERCGARFVNINALVKQGLRDMPGLYRPADKNDLKRTAV